MNKLVVIQEATVALKLHPKIMDILFYHKRDVSSGLRDLKGIHGIDHVAIIMINPELEISIFSLFPSVEYNLIANELWKFDRCFNPMTLEDKTLNWWEDSYHLSYQHELRHLKEDIHQFTLGMNLVRKIDGFTLIYSFATRNKMDDLKSYYSNLKDELFQMGDYGYKLIRGMSERYCYPYVAPSLGEEIRRRPHLKLVINNDLR